MKHLILFIGICCYPFILLAQWYPVYVPTTQGLETITFTDTLHGFITVADGSILESSDGGINWQTVLTGSGNSELYDICFPTASTGYSVGDNGHIVKTTNAGSSWPHINSPTNNILRGVFFLNTDTGFICGQGECIYRTTDGGTTWVQQSTGAYWLRKFSFPTPQTGYCAGDNHLVFKTTNRGMTWNQLPGSGGLNLNGIQFLTVDTGYVCGANGYVAKSFNGGLTWQVLNTGTTKNFSGLWFFNSQAGYCVGDLGLIMKTTNGGETWTQETSGTSFSLYHLYFLHQYQGFICGDVGTLLENCLSSPGPITGPSPVCRGDTGKIYSINAVAGATGYHWSVPPGVIITYGSNTNIITVTYTATSVSGSFSVYASKSNCYGTTSPSFSVIVNSTSIPTINGSAQACFGYIYNYTTQPGMSNYSWNISSGGTIISGEGTDQIKVKWNALGSQFIDINYNTPEGCTTSNPTILPVFVGSVAAISIDTAICFGQTYFAGGAFQSESGTYTDTLSVSAGCDSIKITHLTIKDKIPVDLGGNRSICPGEKIILNATLAGATYTWQDSSTDSIFVVTGPGIYWVHVTYDNCNVGDTVEISDCTDYLWFPTAFTPNGDGLNDFFRPKGISITKFHMMIYNRWGQLIFETDNIDTGWDGSVRGAICPTGTYTYIATYEGTENPGKTKKQQGTFILLR
jgi:gliding motility-associated-like protein